MLYMVIERFRGGNPAPVGQRFRGHGRMLPDGVLYHASWIDPVEGRCFQVMEPGSRELLEGWIHRWEDLVDFEVIPVLTSAEYWARGTDE